MLSRGVSRKQRGGPDLAIEEKMNRTMVKQESKENASMLINNGSPSKMSGRQGDSLLPYYHS